MFDLCERLFEQHQIQNLRYDGKMSPEARELCLTKFRKPMGEPKVMLVRSVRLRSRVIVSYY